METNFVMELVLLQEQSASCQTICSLAETQKIELAIPAYALVEPLETLHRHHSRRKQIKQYTEEQLTLLRRSEGYTEKVDRLFEATSVLVDSTELEYTSLFEVQNRLTDVGQILALDSGIIRRFGTVRDDFSLGGPDSLIYASIINDLALSRPATACFLNKNSKDFLNPSITDDLSRFNCTLIPSFDHGLRCISSYLDSQQDSPS